MEKEQVLKEVDNILNDEKIAGELLCLYDRWQDEKEYEDWADYEKVMKKLINHTFVKGTKRPFGFIIKIGESKASFFVKLKGKQVTFSAKYNI